MLLFFIVLSMWLSEVCDVLVSMLLLSVLFGKMDFHVITSFSQITIASNLASNMLP